MWRLENWGKWEEGKKNRDGCHWWSPEFTVGLRRGVESSFKWALCSPQHLFLPEWSEHAADEPSNQSRDQIKVQQLCCSTHHGQAENKATKPDRLLPPSQSLLPCTIPKLAMSPRRNSGSESWVTKQNLYNPEDWRESLWKVDAHHSKSVVEIKRPVIWGPAVAITGRRTKPQTHKPDSPSPALLHPSQLIPLEAPGTPWAVTASSFWLQGAALGLHGLRTPSLSILTHRGGALRWRQPGHKRAAHLLMEYRTFSSAL